MPVVGKIPQLAVMSYLVIGLQLLTRLVLALVPVVSRLLLGGVRLVHRDPGEQHGLRPFDELTAAAVTLCRLVETAVTAVPLGRLVIDDVVTAGPAGVNVVVAMVARDVGGFWSAIDPSWKIRSGNDEMFFSVVTRRDALRDYLKARAFCYQQINQTLNQNESA